MRSVVLASTSRYRAALMARLGIPFETAPPAYAETASDLDDPVALVERHASGKARSLAASHPTSLIVGSDQVVALSGRVLGKPGSHARALEQLRALRGREHTLVTGVAVLDATTDVLASHVDRTRLLVRADLTDAQIEAYVRADSPLDCAGAYKSESLGIALFEYLRGDDPTAIVGMPLAALARLLSGFGVDVLAPETPAGR